MMPHGAPTIRFSTCWQRTARSLGSMCSGHAAMTASIVAASIAAEELTPLPSGTSDSIRMEAPCSKRTACSRASTWNTPATYAAQCRVRSAANQARTSS